VPVNGQGASAGGPSREERRAAWRLAAISFLTLFAELALIRYLSAETRFFGFYKTLALISCFLGLGAGAIAGARGQGRRYFVVGIAALAVLVMIAAPHLDSLRPASVDEFVWMPRPQSGLDTARFYLAMGLFFTLNTAVFFCGGQAVGAAFVGPPALTAYAANLLGSLAGTAAFTLVSYLELGPLWWFLVITGAGTLIFWGDRRMRLANLVAAAATVAAFALLATPARWSPYYKITAEPERAPDGALWGTSYRTNSTYHLRAIDLSDAFVEQHPSVRSSDAWVHYNLPYRFARPRRVLVVGAGAGNDVAAALRAGAEHVDAVEIDPAIAELGRTAHPERPFASPRVTVHVGDARAFLTRARGPYDEIVYGLVDSHTVLAAMSNVRLDNFMYTRASLERARSLLAPGGTVAIAFCSGWGESWWILRRIAAMLERVFGEPPVILDVGYDRGFVFLAGPGKPSRLDDPADRARAASAARKFATDQGAAAAEELTDDWPFMYLRGRSIPAEYRVMGAVVLLLAFLLVGRVMPGGARAVDAHFFFLGAGFLLVEVRNLAELSLLFGSTWIVNAFVIGGVLAMAFLANLVAPRVRLPQGVAFALLGAAVAVSFLSPVKLLGGAAPLVQGLAGTGLLSLPFFFSGLVFSTSFARAPSASAAYGSNLLGAVAGGLLEHASLSHGIRMLSIVALGLYGLAFAARLRRSEAAWRGAGA